MGLAGKKAPLAALVLVVCLAPACSSLLGLGDFKDAPADAGSAGGSGGGGAGTGGTAGTAGTAGSGGAAGQDAGGDASDAGTLTCKMLGAAPFNLFSDSDVSATTLDSDTLLVVNGPSSAGPPSNAYVVVAADHAGGPPSIVVQTLRDNAQNRVSMLSTYAPPGFLRLQKGYADATSLHLLGWMGTDLVDLVFQLGNNGDAQNPTLNTLVSNACPVSLGSACFMGQGANLDEFVTCEQPAGDGGSMKTLYLDGTQIGSPDTTDDNSVHDCLTLGSTMVAHTGPDFGNVTVRYGTTAKELAVAHQFILTTQQGRETALGPLLPTPNNDGLVVLALTANTKLIVPADVYTGVVPITKFADFDQQPMPELSKLATLTDPTQVPNTAPPNIKQGYFELAGATTAQDNVALIVVSSTGNLLVFGDSLYTTNTANVLAAAIGSLGITDFVTWEEQDPNTSGTRLVAQLLSCVSGP